MALEYRIIESAPLPVKEKKESKPRQKYDFAAIPVGGAAAYPANGLDEKKIKSLKSSIYQSTLKFRKANSGANLKVTVEKNEETGAPEIWVRRLADNAATATQGGAESVSAPSAPDTAETVTNGSYGYSLAAAE